MAFSRRASAAVGPRTRGKATRGCCRRASGAGRRSVGAGASAAAAEKGGGGAAAEGGAAAAAREKAAVQFLLDECGFTERVNAQLVIDKASNPDSMAVFKYKNVKNVTARTEISVEGHLRPLVDFFVSGGGGEGAAPVTRDKLRHIFTSYPPILVYDIDTRVKPVVDFLRELGSEDPISVIADRPSLLGLDATTALPQIVSYLRRNDYTDEQILEMVSKTI